MSNTTTTTLTFDADLTAAREIYSTLKRGTGQRPQAVKAFLDATSHEEREQAVTEWGAGFVRRGLREAAAFLEAHDRQDEADVFWALRDDIDMDGDVFQVEAA